MFKLTGVVVLINDTVQVTDKFSKREFVIEDSSSMYPQQIMFQSVQDKCAMLDGYQEGSNVEVSFNLRGREWTSPTGEVKYFNTLDAWRIEEVGAMIPQAAPTANAPSKPTPQGAVDDDLPF